MRQFKYLVKPDGNWSYVKVDVDTIQLPEGWIMVDEKPVAYLSADRVNVRRDELTGQSPLATPYGDIDFKPLDREKHQMARGALAAMDAGDPNNAPHKLDWSMHDNSIVMLGAADFDNINITAAVRGKTLHDAAKRVKAALVAGTTPADADLIILGFK